MPRTLQIFLALVVVASACGRTNAQSVSSPASSVQATDVFSKIHDVLDKTVAGMISETTRGASDTTDRDRTAVEMRPSAANAAEIERNDVPARETNHGAAMRRLEQLRPLLNPILQSEGVPVELAFVVVVESGGKPDALSPKGARGLWQLMPDTARRYGLVVNDNRDERLDIEKSTRTAARYLRGLHTQFQSWTIALAAYNAGEQVVQNAIDRAKSNEFTVLSSRELLPQETRTYVPAVMNFVARSGGMHTAGQEATPGPREERIVYAMQASEDAIVVNSMGADRP